MDKDMDKNMDNDTDNFEEELYQIRVFDDGNQKYQYIPNEWIIISRNNGKVTLKNVNGKDIIYSISAWKLDNIVYFLKK